MGRRFVTIEILIIKSTLYLIFSPDKLAPDACPAAKNRKRFNPAQSNALAVLQLHEKGGSLFPEMDESSTRRE